MRLPQIHTSNGAWIFSNAVAMAVIASTGVYAASGPDTMPTSMTTRTFYATGEVAFGGDTIPADSAHTLLAITMTLPAAGRVAIDVNTALWTDFPASAASTLFGEVELARCTASDTVSEPPCRGINLYYMQKPPNSSATDITEPLTISDVLTFNSGGTKTFYINGYAAAYPGGLYSNAYVRIAFTPNAPVPSNSTVQVTVAP